jgi:hypothetical protein
MRFACLCALLLASSLLVAQSKPTSNLNYADFEKDCSQDECKSTRGGNITYTVWQEQAEKAGTSSPVFVAADANGTNRLAFNYKLIVDQKFAGAGMTINGQPAGPGGKLPSDDLSGYKELSFDMEASGPRRVRVQFLSENTGLTVTPGFEAFCVVQVTPGMQNYRCPLKKVEVAQDAPASNASAKQILKQVTSLQFVVTELGSSGHVLLDNITFLK